MKKAQEENRYISVEDCESCPKRKPYRASKGIRFKCLYFEETKDIPDSYHKFPGFCRLLTAKQIKDETEDYIITSLKEIKEQLKRADEIDFE